MSYQTVQQWEREPEPSGDGKTPLSTAPSRKRLPAVAALLGVTQHWLLTGEDGDGNKSDPIEAQLLLFYRGVNEEMKALIVQQANALYNATNPEVRTRANPFPRKKPPKGK